jgi:hypothetical protein
LRWAGRDVSSFICDQPWRKYKEESKDPKSIQDILDKVVKVTIVDDGVEVYEKPKQREPLITESKNLWGITDFEDRTIKDFEKEPECPSDYRQEIKEARRLKQYHTYASKKPALAKGSHTLVNDRSILTISADGKKVVYCEPTHREVTVSYKHFRDWAKTDITSEIIGNSVHCKSWRYWHWLKATQEEGYININGYVPQSLSRTYLCKSYTAEWRHKVSDEVSDESTDNDESKFFHKKIIAGDWLTYIPEAALDNKDDTGVFIVYAIEEGKNSSRILGAGINTFRQGYVNPRLMRHVEFNERVELIKKVKNNNAN